MKQIQIKKGGAISIARTANVFVRVEHEMKRKQSRCLIDLINVNAVRCFLEMEFSPQRGIPFEMKLQLIREPVAYGFSYKGTVRCRNRKRHRRTKTGRVYSADEVEAEINGI